MGMLERFRAEQDTEPAEDRYRLDRERHLPPWEPLQLVDSPELDPPLIHGILRRGHLALFVGKGKSGKTWAMTELALTVATGGEWLGFKCEQGRVLFIDPECEWKQLNSRFSFLAGVMGLDMAATQEAVQQWALRGVHDASIDKIAEDLEADAGGGLFDLIIVDSASAFVRGDENSSVDIRRFAADVLRIADITGASVMLVHHFGKGNAGDRDASDRPRGSSVWFDFPDVVLTLTEVYPPEGDAADYLQDGERAFLLEEPGQRDFPSWRPVRLISSPAWRIDEEGLTDGWKPSSGRRAGGQKTGAQNAAKARERSARCEAALLAEIAEGERNRAGLNGKEAVEAVGARLGETIKLDTLKAYAESWDSVAFEQTGPRRCLFKLKNPPAEPDPELPL